MTTLRRRLAAPVIGLSARAERHLLQGAIAACGFVPVLGGLAGALLGTSITGETAGGLAADSQMRMLSGLLLGVGLAYWEAIPQIERRGARIRLLTVLVGLGGLMRLVSLVFVTVPPSPVMLVALGLELVVAPGLCLWQARVARRCGMHLS